MFRFKIHYINDRGITYLSLSEDMSDDDCFAFLIDVQRKLNKTNDVDLNSMNAYQLDTFKEELKSIMVFIQMIYLFRHIIIRIHL